jgi:uncharacterized protein YlxW (UPF0749 family)
MGILYYSKRNFRALLFPCVCRTCATATAAARQTRKEEKNRTTREITLIKKKYIARQLGASLC